MYAICWCTHMIKGVDVNYGQEDIVNRRTKVDCGKCNSSGWSTKIEFAIWFDVPWLRFDNQ